jgi:hypothetical protein
VTLIRKTEQVDGPPAALPEVRDALKSLYAAIQRVRAGRTGLVKREKQRPLTAMESRRLRLLVQEHERLRQELDRLVQALWQLTGEAAGDTLNNDPVSPPKAIAAPKSAATRDRPVAAAHRLRRDPH